MARKARPSSRQSRQIDGAALRAVLKSYQERTLDAERARDVMLKLGVAGNPADQLLHAFRPRPEQSAEATP